MNYIRYLLFSVFILLFSLTALASIFGDVRGLVRDPQQRPLKDAKVSLRAKTSDFSKTAQTNDAGEFLIRSIPVGEYTLTVEYQGFGKSEKAVTVISDSAQTVQVQLEVAPV